MEYSRRIKNLPPYLFAEIEEAIAKKKKEGVDIISLGIGDPDIPTPEFIRESLAKEAMRKDTHNYSSSKGEEDFRNAVAEWYMKRFNVELDPDSEVCSTVGSKEGIANLARAYVNPGDIVLSPDPAYPVYANGASILNDGRAIAMPLKEENGFMPEISSLPEEAKKAKVMFLNYPNNPTGAIATEEFLKEAIEYCQENDIVLCYDNAYSEFTFDDYSAPSILNYTKDAIEMNSCSKTFCMTGDRIGFAVGKREIVEGLRKVKSQIDSGAPVYVQNAAVTALGSYTSADKPKEVQEIMDEYEKRRDVLVSGLNEMGIECKKPKATFYIWAKCPEESSIEFAKKVLDAGVVITPGIGFGSYGGKYLRFATTQSVERINEALERMKSAV